MALLVILGWVFRAQIRAVAGVAPASPPAQASAGAQDARVIPVVVVPVSRQDEPIFLEGLGSVTPIASVTVKTQVDGRLDKVAFTEGQMVHKGDVIAQIDPRPFAIQLHQAEAALARDTAQLREANLNLQRYRALGKDDLIAKQQIDDQQALADQYSATTRGDQAQVDNARLMIDYARIVAPIDGVTGVRLVDAGNLLHAADPTGIVVITQLDPIALLFTLPEDDLPAVSKALSAGPISVEALSRDGTVNLGSGQLSLIDNEINQATATMRLKALLPNHDKLLWPNQFVKARLRLTTRKGAIVVPSTVVQRGPQGTFAYVVGADSTVSMRAVDVESIQGETAIVSRGLSPGEKVVADGQNQLRPGSKVSAHAPDTGPGNEREGGAPAFGAIGAPSAGSGAPP